MWSQWRDSDANRILQKSRPTQLNLSPSERNFGGKSVAISENVVTINDDKRAMSEVGDALIFKQMSKVDLKLVQGEITNAGSSRDGKDTISTPISLTSTKRDSVDEPAVLPNTHRRAKKSTDNTRPSDRLSLFGSISGTIGKSRKPPPRYSAGYVLLKT
jgi:hypothetical protein